MLRRLRTVLPRHPLVPFAIVALLADALYLSAVVHPRQDRLFASLVARAEAGERLRLSGEVASVRAPVPATRGELKHRFVLRDPRVGEGARALKGSLPVIWYAPRPENAGFAPEPGALFVLEGRVHVRQRLADGVPRKLEDLLLISRARDTRVLATRHDAPDGFLSRVRQSAAERLSRGLDGRPVEKSLILAMTLGFRSDIPRRTTQAFRRAGTIHIFAISGLHVLLIAGILAWCLGSFGVSCRHRVLVLAPLLAVYIFLTGGRPSALRAGLMAVLLHAAPLFGRRSDPLNAVALAALVLVLLRPEIGADLGFILSFSMVAGMIVFLPAVDGAFSRLFRVAEAQDALAVDRLAAAPATWRAKLAFAIRHAALRTRRWLAHALPVALTASLVSFPLNSHFFGFCTSYALLANLVVVPLAGVAMGCSAAGLALSCLHPALATPANLAAALLAGLMKDISVAVATLPGSAPLMRFPLWAVAAWYAALWGLCALLSRLVSGRQAPNGGE